MIAIKKHIPNFITCLNLASGTIASIYAFEGQLVYAAFFILLAAVFDFADGFMARLLKAYSPMGKELDSLADIISFGLAPAVIVYTLLKLSIFNSFSLPELSLISYPQFILLFIPVLLAIFSGLRLAKFNVDERQTENFIGLATPANAMFFISLPFVLQGGRETWILNPYLLSGLVFLHSFLLVSEIPMFSLKIKSLAWKQNQARYLFFIIAAVIFGYFGMKGLGLIIWIYVITSILQTLFERTQRK